jgi:hypothetical protein
MHLKDGHHVSKFTAQATKEREHHLSITDRITKLSEGGSHGFKAAAVVDDG